jgi:NAD+ synthase (glutamine-hydrolysing)
MPGPGTTKRTQENAENLARALGTTAMVVPIFAALAGHLADIGADPADFSIAYQNAQARERTQILMDLGNKLGGFVIGTGDLSEIALGWCTFNGDHMSMYHVNCGIPKTLVRYLVDWSADEEFTGAESATLRDISATPISPELLPTAADGSLVQQTEQSIGPYRLHDFFLYYGIRFGFPPAKVFYLASVAFAGEFTPPVILGWLRVFYARFFAAQFKRNASPDGPKVGSVALSPRGDWRMPSDGCAEPWLAQCDLIEAELALKADPAKS